MSEPDTLLVIRCTEPRPPTAGGTIKCAACSEDCWIAPTSIAYIKGKPHIRVLCLNCAADLAKKYGPTIKELVSAPGADQEIAEAMARDKSKRR